MLWLLLMAPALLLALWAQSRVSSTFRKFQDAGTRSGLSGADVARILLRARGLDHVKVERTQGFLTDHYDPRDKTLRLSAATHDKRSIAAIGVAAHEAGHALQDADAYAPLQFRSNIVPVVSIGSRVLPFLIIAALVSGGFAQGGPLAWIVVIVTGLIALFSVMTLPVEYNASSRALALLENGGILAADEMVGARKVLNAAALTYVAAAVAAVMEMAYWLLHLVGGSSEQ